MPKVFTDEDRLVIREKMLATGLAMLETKNYKNISLDEITAQNGIVKGTFYHFFSSKESCFHEVVYRIKDNNRMELKQLFDKKPVETEDIKAYLIHRYTDMKTVYDYFTPGDITRIVRMLPNGDSEDDSVQFARLLIDQSVR